MDGAFQNPCFQLHRSLSWLGARPSSAGMRKGGFWPPLSDYFVSVSILSSGVVSPRQVLEFILASGISGLRGIPRFWGLDTGFALRGFSQEFSDGLRVTGDDGEVGAGGCGGELPHPSAKGAEGERKESRLASYSPALCIKPHSNALASRTRMQFRPSASTQSSYAEFPAVALGISLGFEMSRNVTTAPTSTPALFMG